MPSGGLLIGFIASALVVLVIPGPGVVYVVARSVGQGQRAGLASVLGLTAGAAVHVAAAAAGLSALLVTSATAFGVVKALGAGYLIYLGLRTLLAPRRAVTADGVRRLPLGRVFRDGVIISALNPKIAVFFLAFLPQFVDPSAGPAGQQILVLGLIYLGLALISDGSYALLAGGMRKWLKVRVLMGPLPRYLSGGLYIGLGVYAALTGRRPVATG